MSDEERSIAGDEHGSVHGERNDISNADQMSLLNSSIDAALKKQSDNFLQYLDSRISQLKPTPLPVDDFTFTEYSISLIPTDQPNSVKFWIV